MKEIGVVSWKLPPREMSSQHFREIPPHVYSIFLNFSGLPYGSF